MNTIAQLLDPVLLVVAAAVPFAIGAILFLLYRRGPDSMDMRPGLPLSWAEPMEIRLVLYFLFAAIWGVIAFVFRVLYEVSPEESIIALVPLLLLVAAFLLDAAFAYAAAGTLLQAALGTRGRPPFWFSRLLGPMDSAIMTFGDMIGGLLLNTGAPAQRPVAEPAELAFETDELDLDIPPRGRRRASSAGPGTAAATAEASAPPLRARVNRKDPYAVARDRLDTRITEYENRLTQADREKYLLMKELVEYLKGRG